MADKRPDRTLGSSDRPFWGFCEKGELRLQHCRPCDRRFWPPTPQCSECGGGLNWDRLSGRGEVIAFCTFERQYYPELPPPVDTILVRLEEGPLFLSNPLGFSGTEVKAGMRVKVAFITVEDSAGEFRLPVFKKA